MAHQRKLIRHAVVDLLKVNATAAGVRVNPTRVEPHSEIELPSIGVYTLSDTIVTEVNTSLEDTHSLDLEIVGWVEHRDSAPADDAMDDLAEQIETVMRANPSVSGTVESCDLVSTVMEIVETDGRSDPTVGIVALTYSVVYRTSQATTDELDEFLRADAKHKLVGGVSDTPVAEDLINVRSTP